MIERLAVTSSRKGSTILRFILTVSVKNMVAKGETHKSITRELHISKVIDWKVGDKYKIGSGFMVPNDIYRWISGGHLYHVVEFVYNATVELPDQIVKPLKEFNDYVDSIVKEIKA